MSKALYVVIHSREKWWVDFEGRAYGPFSTMHEATDEGRQLAKFSAHSGRPSEVLVPDEQGRYRVVWDSGKEPRAGRDHSITHAA